MAERRRPVTSRDASRSSQASIPALSRIPTVYRDLLSETVDGPGDDRIESQRKKRKTRHQSSAHAEVTPSHDDGHEEEEFEFEDVAIEEQTIYREPEGDSDSDRPWQNYDVASQTNSETEELDLTLHHKVNQVVTPKKRSGVIIDRSTRIVIHKMHLLCLLCHVDMRNSWCNDNDVQTILSSLIPTKISSDLKPKKDLSQFRRADLLKSGLDAVNKLWSTKFGITSRGIRRSYWLDDRTLQNFKLPQDTEDPLEKSDFVRAATSLKGSRTLRAQLLCALLRSTGLDVRLVCSLQALPLTGSAIMPIEAEAQRMSDSESTDEVVDIKTLRQSPSSGVPFAAQRRVGQPEGVDLIQQTPAARFKRPRYIRESPYPTFWVEVLDEAHQRWLSVDTETLTIGKPQALEPPLTDRENSMSYVIAFEDDGSARDITLRYTKAYTAKTRRTRVDMTEDGTDWWKKVMRYYARKWQRDLDQIEDAELARLQAREPMPKNISDFKNHPNYALERHLRKNEVLLSRHEVGKVVVGKKQESVFRRSDVQRVRSADRWYRMGRDVKVNQQPVKVEGDVGLYTLTQTELYASPPVVNGRVPRNAFGNIDVYVPSMIPPGGAHVPHDDASRAARIAGIDFADAVTGFKFEGRQGRPVIHGIIVAQDSQAAILAIIDGISDERAQFEDELRSVQALRTWKAFLIGLRIKERVDGYEIEGEDMQQHNGRETSREAGTESQEAGGFIPD